MALCALVFRFESFLTEAYECLSMALPLTALRAAKDFSSMIHPLSHTTCRTAKTNLPFNVITLSDTASCFDQVVHVRYPSHAIHSPCSQRHYHERSVQCVPFDVSRAIRQRASTSVIYAVNGRNVSPRTLPKRSIRHVLAFVNSIAEERNVTNPFVWWIYFHSKMTVVKRKERVWTNIYLSTRRRSRTSRKSTYRCAIPK